MGWANGQTRMVEQAHGYLRVIDESGEDYGYSAERFFLLDVPLALQKALSAGLSSFYR